MFYLFVLMLLDLPREETGPRFGVHWPLGAAAGLAFAALAWYANGSNALGLVATAAPTSARSPALGSLSTVGTALFTEFALPFEIVSLLLLAAIVGTIVIAKRRTES